MSTRRLQKIKGGSYIISLPSEWVRKNGLDVKSELKVYEIYDGLKIKPERKINNEREIILRDLNETLYLISVYYMQGIEKIIVKSDNVMSQEVKKALRELQLTHAGLEIEDETFNKIVFKVNLPVSTDLNGLVSSFVDKIRKLLYDLRVLGKFDKEIKEDLITRCDILMKDYRVIIRNIAIGVQLDDLYNFGLPFKDIILYAIFMRDLGRLISHLRTFLMLTDEKSIPSTELIDTLISMFTSATSMFMTENLSDIQQIRRNMKMIEEKCNTTIEACKEFVRMASYCVAIMDDAVHKSVRLI
ncbi:AbrB/MazE/SpoVT family DNA-binding domain-containing protein [Sulfurisphaera ohwakuensis]|uniref:AbrB/MazE/SpoVT family DNA-binding domain-containing protein n=1 Tax=Sulfurisphaera ohwakuensis TaxID=69656 RepID=A0A650CJN5_SULOH|nr:phosphate uptake regulator PhoU [Sulfurisphaera ohwakuensis]MBB5254653.1 phosphate uptake regulator [Sulfurisphaera ohwakuensis]QGR18042.1 AbrB/MazE/SpoVT family DNA-binding domain-containing protein [Sulfurisphaera ohwakuensis]